MIPGKEGLTPGQVEEKRRDIPPERIDELLGKTAPLKVRPPKPFDSPKPFTFNPLTNVANYLATIPPVPDKPEDRLKAAAVFIPPTVNAKVAAAAAESGVRGEDFWHMVHQISASVPDTYTLLQGGIRKTGKDVWVNPWTQKPMNYKEACTFMQLHKEEVVAWWLNEMVFDNLKPKEAKNVEDYFNPRVVSEVMRTLGSSGYYASSEALQTFSLAVASSTVMKPTDLVAFRENYKIAQDPALGLDFNKPVDTMNALMIAANAAHDGVKMSTYNDLITYVYGTMVEIDKKTKQPVFSYATTTLDYERDANGEPDYSKPIVAPTGQLGHTALSDPEDRQFFGELISYRAMMDSLEGKSLSAIEKWAVTNYGEPLLQQLVIGASGGQIGQNTSPGALTLPPSTLQNHSLEEVLKALAYADLIQRAIDAGLSDGQIWGSSALNPLTNEPMRAQDVGKVLMQDPASIPSPDVYIERLNMEEGTTDVVNDLLRAKVQAAQAYFLKTFKPTSTASHVYELQRGVRGRSAQYVEKDVTTTEGVSGTAGITSGSAGFAAQTAFVLSSNKLGKTINPEMWTQAKFAMKRAIEYSRAVYSKTDLDKTAWGMALSEAHNTIPVTIARSPAHWSINIDNQKYGLAEFGGMVWSGLNVPLGWIWQGRAALGYGMASFSHAVGAFDEVTQADITEEFRKEWNDWDEIVGGERTISSILMEDYDVPWYMAIPGELALYVVTDPFLYAGTAYKLAKEAGTLVEGSWREGFAAVQQFRSTNSLSVDEALEAMRQIGEGEITAEEATRLYGEGWKASILDQHLFDVLGVRSNGQVIDLTFDPIAVMKAQGYKNPLKRLKTTERLMVQSRQAVLDTASKILEASWLDDFRFAKTARNGMAYFREPLETVWTRKVVDILETRFKAVGLPSAEAGKEVTMAEGAVEAVNEALVDAGYLTKTSDGIYVPTKAGKAAFKAPKLGKTGKLTKAEQEIVDTFDNRHFFNFIRRTGPRVQYERYFKAFKGPWRKIAIEPKIRAAIYDMVAAKHFTGASLTEKDMVTIINEVLFRGMRGCPIGTPIKGSLLARYYEMMTDPDLASLFNRGVVTFGADDAKVLSQWDRVGNIGRSTFLEGGGVDAYNPMPGDVEKVLDLAKNVGITNENVLHNLAIYAKDARGVEEGSSFTSLTDAIGMLIQASRDGHAQVFIPKLRTLPTRKLIEEIIPWLETNDGALGSVTRGMQYARDALGSVVPSMAAPFNDGLADWTRNKLARARVFSREEIAEFSAKALALGSTTTKTSRYLDREGHIYSFLKEMDAEIVRRIAASRGITDSESVGVIISRLQKGVDNFNESFFGINARVLEAIRAGKSDAELALIMIEEGKIGKLPEISETLKAKHIMTDADLWTRMMTLDPVFVRQLFDESIGMTRGIVIKLQKLFGDIEVDDATRLFFNKRSGDVFDVSKKAVELNFRNQGPKKFLNGQIWQRFVADTLSRLNMAFKYNAILSGRYAMRVPIMDEQMRIAADIGVVNRLLSGRKIYNPVLTKLFPHIEESRLGGAVPVTVNALVEAQLDARVRELEIGFNSWEDFLRGVDSVFNPNISGGATEEVIGRVFSAPTELRDAAIQLLRGSPKETYGVARSVGERRFLGDIDNVGLTRDPYVVGGREILYTADGSSPVRQTTIGGTLDDLPLQTISSKINPTDPLVNVAHEKGHAILIDMSLPDDFDAATAARIQDFIEQGGKTEDITAALLSSYGVKDDRAFMEGWIDAILGEGYGDGKRAEAVANSAKRWGRFNPDTGKIEGKLPFNWDHYRPSKGLPSSDLRIKFGPAHAKEIEDYLHESFAEMYTLWHLDPDALKENYPVLFAFFRKHRDEINRLATQVAPGNGKWKHSYIDIVERETKPSQLRLRQSRGHIQTFLFSGDKGFMDEQKIGHALDTILNTMPPSEVHIVLDADPHLLQGFNKVVKKQAKERGITTITEKPLSDSTVEDENVRYVFGFHKDSPIDNPHFSAVDKLDLSDAGYAWYQPGEPLPVAFEGNIPRRFSLPHTTIKNPTPTLYLPVPNPTRIGPVPEFNSGIQANFWRTERQGDALRGVLRAGGEAKPDPKRMVWDTFKWGPTPEEQADFFKGWYRVLNYQYGRGEIGPFLLELRSRQRITKEDMKTLLKEKILNTKGLPERTHILNDDGEIMVTALNKWVDGAVDYAWEVIPNEDIARIAWQDPGGSTLDRALREYVETVRQSHKNPITGEIPDITNFLPVVNGMRAELSMSIPNHVSDFIEKASTVLFESITNKMNRQPYGAYWYSRTYRALTEQCAAWGIVPGEVEKRAIEIIAQDFAVKRVKDVLFDFQRQNRFMELMGVVTPFLQPYVEAMVVWKRMLVRNPGFAAYMFDAYRGLQSAGYARTDPVTGQQEFAIPVLSKLLHSALAPIGNATGLNSKLAEGMGGIDFLLPFNSLNFIFNQTLDIPLGDFNFPLPVPGLSPPFMYVIQTLTEKTGLLSHIPDSMKISYIKWLYQYGAMNFGDVVGSYIAPRWVLQFAQSMGVDLVSTERTEDTLQGYRDKMLVLMDAEGVTVERLMDPEYAQSVAGMTFKQPSDAQAWRNEQADIAAKRAIGYIAVMSNFFPGTIHPSYPTEFYQIEWDKMLEAHGSDYEGAFTEFITKYPDMTAITVSKYFASTPIPGTNTPTEWRVGNQITVPATDANFKFLTSPEFAELSKTIDPRLLFSLLPSLDVAQGELKYNTGVSAWEIATGMTSMKTTSQYQADIDVKKGQALAYDASTIFRMQKDAFEQQGIGESDATYIQAKAVYDQTIDYIEWLYPGYKAYYDPKFYNTGVEDPMLLRELESAVTNNPAFAKTAVGQAAQQYFSLVEKYEPIMRGLGIASINSKLAEDYIMPGGVSLSETVTAEFDALRNSSGGFDKLWQVALDGTLTNLTSLEDEELKKLTPEQQAVVVDFETQMGPYDQQINQTNDPGMRSAAFYARSKLISEFYQKYGDVPYNPVKLWWDGLNYKEKDSYVMNLTNKSPLYYNEFERTAILGLPTNQQAEDTWLAINNLLVTQELFTSNVPGDISKVSDAIKAQIDTLIQVEAQANPTFAHQVYSLNTPGFKFFAGTGYATLPANQGGDSWRMLEQTCKQFSFIIQNYGITGYEQSDVIKRNTYLGMTEALNQLVEQLKRTDPVFADQWFRLDDANGADLLTQVLLPEPTYTIGGSSAWPAIQNGELQYSHGGTG